MFWENFLKLCNEFNKSPNAVAKELGITSGTVTAWKKGGVPYDRTKQKIADYFGITVGELMGEERTEKAPSSRRGVRIPVYGAVAAGIPIEAITDIEDYEEISEELAKKGEYIALKIKGRSMLPDFRNGDTVIVRLQDDVESGEIAIVMVNGGEATCKRIEKNTNGVTLIPLNTDEYSSKSYTNAEIEELPVKILGKVIELRRVI